MYISEMRRGDAIIGALVLSFRDIRKRRERERRFMVIFVDDGRYFLFSVDASAHSQQCSSMHIGLAGLWLSKLCSKISDADEDDERGS